MKKESKIERKMKEYLENDEDILFILCQNKSFGRVEVGFLHNIPIMNMPMVIDNLQSAIDGMRKFCNIIRQYMTILNI